MNAAETSASSAIADCTPLTVVSRSRTTAEIDTFINGGVDHHTNIATASSSPSSRMPVDSWGKRVLPHPLTRRPRGVSVAAQAGPNVQWR